METFHCIRFSGARLSVSKDSSIVTLQRRIYHCFGCILVNIFLARILIIDVVKCKSMSRIRSILVQVSLVIDIIRVLADSYCSRSWLNRDDVL